MTKLGIEVILLGRLVILLLDMLIDTSSLSKFSSSGNDFISLWSM